MRVGLVGSEMCIRDRLPTLSINSPLSNTPLSFGFPFLPPPPLSLSPSLCYEASYKGLNESRVQCLEYAILCQSLSLSFSSPTLSVPPRHSLSVCFCLSMSLPLSVCLSITLCLSLPPPRYLSVFISMYAHPTPHHHGFISNLPRLSPFSFPTLTPALFPNTPPPPQPCPRPQICVTVTLSAFFRIRAKRAGKNPNLSTCFWDFIIIPAFGLGSVGEIGERWRDDRGANVETVGFVRAWGAPSPASLIPGIDDWCACVRCRLCVVSWWWWWWWWCVVVAVCVCVCVVCVCVWCVCGVCVCVCV